MSINIDQVLKLLLLLALSKGVFKRHQLGFMITFMILNNYELAAFGNLISPEPLSTKRSQTIAIDSGLNYRSCLQSTRMF